MRYLICLAAQPPWYEIDLACGSSPCWTSPSGRLRLYCLPHADEAASRLTAKGIEAYVLPEGLPHTGG